MNITHTNSTELGIVVVHIGHSTTYSTHMNSNDSQYYDSEQKIRRIFRSQFKYYIRTDFSVFGQVIILYGFNSIKILEKCMSQQLFSRNAKPTNSFFFIHQISATLPYGLQIGHTTIGTDDFLTYTYMLCLFRCLACIQNETEIK